MPVFFCKELVSTAYRVIIGIIYHVCWVGYLSNLHHEGQSEAMICHDRTEWTALLLNFPSDVNLTDSQCRIWFICAMFSILIYFPDVQTYITITIPVSRYHFLSTLHWLRADWILTAPGDPHHCVHCGKPLQGSQKVQMKCLKHTWPFDYKT